MKRLGATFKEVLNVVDGDGAITNEETAKLASLIKYKDKIKEGVIRTALEKFEKLMGLAKTLGSRGKRVIKSAMADFYQEFKEAIEEIASDNPNSESASKILNDLKLAEQSEKRLQIESILRLARPSFRIFGSTTSSLKELFNKVVKEDSIFSRNSVKEARRALEFGLAERDEEDSEIFIPKISRKQVYVEAFNNICRNEGLDSLRTDYKGNKEDLKQVLVTLVSEADESALFERDEKKRAKIIKTALLDARKKAVKDGRDDFSFILESTESITSKSSPSDVIEAFRETAKSLGLKVATSSLGSAPFEKMDINDAADALVDDYRHAKAILASCDQGINILENSDDEEYDTSEEYKKIFGKLKAVKELSEAVKGFSKLGVDLSEDLDEAVNDVPKKFSSDDRFKDLDDEEKVNTARDIMRKLVGSLRSFLSSNYESEYKK